MHHMGSPRSTRKHSSLRSELAVESPEVPRNLREFLASHNGDELDPIADEDNPTQREDGDFEPGIV